MSKVYLVAVQHDDMGNLLSGAMYPLIQEQVVPLLTADSVLVVEGGKKRGRMTSDHPDYNVIYSQLGPISYSGLRPTIHSDDPMYLPKQRTLIHYTQDCDDYSNAVLKILQFNNPPNTWEELVSRIKNNCHDAKLTGGLSKRWQAFAKETHEEFVLRDATFTEQINGYLQEDKTVFFFGGVLHCLSLHTQHDWPVIRYPCTPANIRAFYAAWYQAYGMTTLISK